MGGVPKLPVQIFGDGGFANGEDFARQIITPIGHIMARRIRQRQVICAGDKTLSGLLTPQAPMLSMR